MHIDDIKQHPLQKKARLLTKQIRANMRGRVAGLPFWLYLIRVLLGRGCRTYLEIGVLHGGSLCLAMQNKNECIFVGIDPFAGFYGQPVDPTTNVPVTKKIAAANIRKNNAHGHEFDLITGLSSDQKVLNRVRTRYPVIDFIFIDGDHSEPGVTADFNNYSQLVRSGGILIFDNYNDRAWPGVKAAVKALDLRGWRKLSPSYGRALILERK